MFNVFHMRAIVVLNYLRCQLT